MDDIPFEPNITFERLLRYWHGGDLPPPPPDPEPLEVKPLSEAELQAIKDLKNPFDIPKPQNRTVTEIQPVQFSKQDDTT